MKQVVIYILLSLTAFAVSAQEYQYVPFPDSNAVWSEVYWKPISEPCPRWVYNKYALFNEDTVINGITYHKLFHTNDSEINIENSTCIGGIREDSFKRVWYYNFSFPYEEWMPSLLYVQDEITLYDFSVSKGDTIRDINTMLEYEFVVVEQIDTISYKNSLRKVFSFNIPWVYWIEGIGNTKGLIFTSGDLPTNGMDNDLVCFHQNDTLLYHYSGAENTYDGCVPSFVLNDVSILPNPEVKVYPNPATGESVYFEGLNFEKLELYDNNGNLIFSKDISRLDKYVLNISGFIPGVYFYQLKKQGLVSTGGKLIIP
jgi:hypothetical protein